ncbi:MAG: 3-deoxy-D-manno-octulosonic acid transferase [Gammaproteobacteria bacterium RIFCSPHIGHO2_12_FULL_37_14]|nr:MAG: 3-deoxy-D-manno-octulosonic acid transferase [Gammaproteobacteria bacterium RIFCSPHIGHO2_12_FULL_37_14]
MRYFYTVLLYLALPFIFIRLFWRSRQISDYRRRLGERLGFYPIQFEKCIWVHAVSVGEVLAAIPLIKALQVRYAELPLLVTTMTPTGAARVTSAFGKNVTHAYLPYDLPGSVNRFLKTMHPTVGLIMETELWPNLLAACYHQHIPVGLLNARLSEKSAKKYHRIAVITRNMLQSLSVIAAHGHVDAKRFIALGASQHTVVVTGNIKFDLQLPNNLFAESMKLRESFGQNRFIWIAASTHEGEEEQILQVHQQLQQKNQQALLILVPRHPDRFDTIFKLSEQYGFKTSRRSQQSTAMSDTAVYLGDTMGELLLMYAASDVAFVGGSLIPRGGHNMLEPGALGKPILMGKHLFNFAEISELFIEARALSIVSSAELLLQLIRLMNDIKERTQMGERARQVVEANRGALNKQLELITKMMQSSVV